MLNKCKVFDEITLQIKRKMLKYFTYVKLL
jgi:hypothetical protein